MFLTFWTDDWIGAPYFDASPYFGDGLNATKFTSFTDLFKGKTVLLNLKAYGPYTGQP